MNTCKICSKKFLKKANTSGHFCSLSCSNVDRGRRGVKTVERLSYESNPKKCPYCTGTIQYKYRYNKFCSRSCSASFNGSRRVHSEESRIKRRISATSHAMANRIVRKCTPSSCKVCGVYFLQKSTKSKARTCSSSCYSTFISISIRGKTGGSTKQYIRYTSPSGEVISLDSSWEVLMAEDLDRNGVFWTRPKSFLLSNGRRYTPDFYIPKLGIYLDPKAYRKGYSLQLEKIRMFEAEYNTVCIVISKVDLLTYQHILSTLSERVLQTF